jgi:hypothetical protein
MPGVTAPTDESATSSVSIVDAAQGLNTTENVAGYTTADAAGEFEAIKAALPADLRSGVEWHEGDDRPMKVAHLVSMMFAMNPVIYPVLGTGPQPSGTYSSPTTTLNR